MISSPVATVDLKREGLDGVVALVEQYDPERIVVGLPKNMSGGEGTQAASVRAFAGEVEEATGRPIVFWDERLTSFVAEQALIQAGHRRQRARKGRIDAVAAALILQSYLEAGQR
jgi:putative Holliday junction resolvase